MPTQTEENYLKAIFKIAEKEKKTVSTNSISRMMKTSAASVTDMIKRLSEKNLIHYEKYRGVSLTPAGNKIATDLIRKHRLWEVFLCDKLHFKWDEVHELAEQLEHIQSPDLVNRLDEFLEHPKFDPHGDPIPNAAGKFTLRNQIALSDMKVQEKGILIGVKTHDQPFLKYLNEMHLRLGSKLKITNVNAYDSSVTVLTDLNKVELITDQVAKKLMLKKITD